VRFTVSERSTVTLRFRRRGRDVVIRRSHALAHRGRNTVTVRSRRFTPRHRYVVNLQARDALGNRSAGERRQITIRRGR
jgi:hypothetical protein